MKAIEVSCPACGAEPNEYCRQWAPSLAFGFPPLHQSRVNAATRMTREANRARRSGAHQ